MKSRLDIPFNAFYRVFRVILFVFSLPLLVLSIVYAAETLFWTEGPQTDYPLLATPRPNIAIRIHGFLCLVSSLALTLVSGTGLAKNTSAVLYKRKYTMIICFACLLSIWWNPWHSFKMDEAERTLKLIVSTPILLMLILTRVAEERMQQNRFTSPITTTHTE